MKKLNKNISNKQPKLLKYWNKPVFKHLKLNSTLSGSSSSSSEASKGNGNGFGGGGGGGGGWGGGS